MITAQAAIGAAAPVLSASRLYRSPAWPDPADPPFVNAVVRVAYVGDPETLLAFLHQTEGAFGRRRGTRNAPRTLDLDLIAFGRLVVTPGKGDGLQLPHPALAERDFVLAPLCDVAPDWRSPISGKTASDMLAALPEAVARPLDE